MKMTHKKHLPSQLIIHQSNHLLVGNISRCYYVYCIQPNVTCYHRYRAGYSLKQQYLPGHFIPLEAFGSLYVRVVQSLYDRLKYKLLLAMDIIFMICFLLASWRSCLAVQRQLVQLWTPPPNASPLAYFLIYCSNCLPSIMRVNHSSLTIRCRMIQ